jgi:hypothetical protein
VVMTQLSQSLVVVLSKLIMLNTKMFSTLLECDQIFFTHANKKVECWPNKWAIKDINDNFKVVASRYHDESEHIYKMGKSSPPPVSNKFNAMVANANDDSKLWHFHLNHTNYGSKAHESALPH